MRLPFSCLGGSVVNAGPCVVLVTLAESIGHVLRHTFQGRLCTIHFSGMSDRIMMLIALGAYCGGCGSLSFLFPLYVIALFIDVSLATSPGLVMEALTTKAVFAWADMRILDPISQEVIYLSSSDNATNSHSRPSPASNYNTHHFATPHSFPCTFCMYLLVCHSN